MKNSTSAQEKAELSCPRRLLLSMEPLTLLSIHAAETGQYNIIPGWTVKGLYLKVSSVGHIVGNEMQLWFDKPALKRFVSKLYNLIRLEQILFRNIDIGKTKLP